MKVLIITYYWPPAGGSGVQRWLKFVKYLPQFGVTPIVYTVDDPNYPIVDASLAAEVSADLEVLKKPIVEPNDLFSFFGSKKQQTSAGFLDQNPTFFGKIAQYIRANFFIPDARKYWIKPSVNYLKDYIRKNNIELIITTGPPHSLHLIGLKLKQLLKVKWIADFRDPWTEIDYFHQLPLTKRSLKKHHDLERMVVSSANKVIVVSSTMKENFKKFTKDIEVITNGFDGEILNNNYEKDSHFSITHIGMMNADRNPKVLWKVLQDLVSEREDIKKDLHITLIGKLAKEVTTSLQEYALVPFVEQIDYLPHAKVMQFQKRSQVLLIAVNRVPGAKGIITGKIFEYLQVKRPILAIGPIDGDLAEIIHSTKSGTIVDFDDEDTLKKTILEMYTDFRKGSLHIDSQHIEKYHRKQLTAQLVEVIKALQA